jgi:hypothetical protein
MSLTPPIVKNWARPHIDQLVGSGINRSVRHKQSAGGKGVSGDTPIADMYTSARLMRIADGPDEVHMNQLAKFTMAQVELQRQAGTGGVHWFGD